MMGVGTWVRAVREMNLLVGFLIPVLFAGINEALAQCDDNSVINTDSSNVIIKSPHFSSTEYNKSATCKWEFHPQSSHFALVINITKLKLYSLVNGGKVCLGSYNLSINNEQIACDEFIQGPDKAACYAYYSSSSCSQIPEVRKCKNKSRSPYPIFLAYNSDGRTLENPNENVTQNLFFKMQYSFFECSRDTTPAASITTAIPPDATSSTSTRSATMSQLATTAKPTEISDELTSLVKSSSHQSSYITGEMLLPHVTETKSMKPPIADPRGVTAGPQRMIIIIAAAGGGGLFLIVIVVAVLCICKSRRRQGANQEAPPKDDKSGKILPVDQTYSSLANITNEISGENPYNTLAETIPTGHSASPDSNGVDLHDVLGGQNPSNQAAPKASNMTDISGEETYNVLGEVCPTNHSDSNVCDEMAQSGEGTYDVLRGAKSTGHSAPGTYEEVELPRDEAYGKLGKTNRNRYSVKGAYEEVDLKEQLTYDRLDGSQDAAISSHAQVETQEAAPSLPSTHEQSQSELYATVSKSIKIRGTSN